MINNCILENSILSICEFEYNYFLHKTNVVGLGMGYKEKKGIVLNNLCICVFVTKKVPLIELSHDNIIPNMYKGILTDVIETGEFTFSSLTSRIRPVIGGYSISTLIVNRYGTFGCLVTDGDNKFMLSCNHVLALNNRAPLYTPIIQPAFEDGGQAPNDIVANLAKYIELLPSTIAAQPPNFVDCAMAELVNPNIAISSIAYIGKVKGTKIPVLNEEVKKIGRTSGLTNGYITHLNATVSLITDTGELLLFKKQIVTTPMSLGGDSGALLLNKDNYALGLLFSASSTRSVFNLIDLVLISLGVYIVTN